MTNQTIHPCPKCEVVPEVDLCYTPTSVVVCCQLHPAYSVDTVLWVDLCDLHLGRACRELGVETVEQVRELVGIACDACDERTVRATNRAENLVPLLRRRAVKGEK